MDNAIFDGVWIELSPPKEFDYWDSNFCGGCVDKSLECHFLPGETFYSFPVANSENIAFLHMKSGKYECPINRYDDHIEPFYEILFKGPIEIDLPNGEVKELIENTNLYQSLIKEFGKDNISLKFGKFMCVS